MGDSQVEADQGKVIVSVRYDNYHVVAMVVGSGDGCVVAYAVLSVEASPYQGVLDVGPEEEAG